MCELSKQREGKAMSYKEVVADIFALDVNAICNTVNCVGVMGKGIALEFKKRYPQMFNEYKRICEQQKLRPGQIWCYESPDKLIVNLAVKDHWRDASRYSWVESVCGKIHQIPERYLGTKSIAIPIVGAMNGWLDINGVLEIMRDILTPVGDLLMDIYVVFYGETAQYCIPTTTT